MGVFLIAQHVTTAEVGIPATRLLRDSAAGFQLADLTGRLEDDRIADARDGIQVLGLRARAERGAGMADGDVAVTTQLALFHIAVGHTRLGEHRHERTQERFSFGGGTEVGLGDNLEQRHASAVIVDQGAAAGVTQFTHIFFEVGVVNTDVLMLAHHIAGGTG